MPQPGSLVENRAESFGVSHRNKVFAVPFYVSQSSSRIETDKARMAEAQI
jgi:hypothetical protein